MQKATVTYRSPPGDNKVVEMGGVTFFDGKPVEINSYDHAHLMSKLQNGNILFDVELGKEDNQPPPKIKRGRPSNADIAAAKELAAKTEADAKIAADKAKEAKIDHDALTKNAGKPDAKPETKPTFAAQPPLPAHQPAQNAVFAPPSQI